MNETPKKQPPKENWICDGNEIPMEKGNLVGDRKGLESLKAAIEQALASKEGEASIQELGSPWRHVRVREAHPEKTQDERDASAQGRLGSLIALSILGIVLFLLVYGCSQLPDLFK